MATFESPMKQAMREVMELLEKQGIQIPPRAAAWWAECKADDQREAESKALERKKADDLEKVLASLTPYQRSLVEDMKEVPRQTNVRLEASHK